MDITDEAERMVRQRAKLSEPEQDLLTAREFAEFDHPIRDIRIVSSQMYESILQGLSSMAKAE